MSPSQLTVGDHLVSGCASPLGCREIRALLHAAPPVPADLSSEVQIPSDLYTVPAVDVLEQAHFHSLSATLQAV